MYRVKSRVWADVIVDPKGDCVQDQYLAIDSPADALWVLEHEHRDDVRVTSYGQLVLDGFERGWGSGPIDKILSFSQGLNPYFIF